MKDSSIRFNGGIATKSSKILDNASWNGMSMMTWIKGNGTRIGNIYTGTYSGGGLYVNADGTVSGYYDGSSAGALISNTKVNDSTWHQIVFQSDGDTSFMYVDGKLEVKKAERMYRTIRANPNAKFYIGTSFQRTYPLRDYDIDRFIIYRDVLSLNQIDSLNKIGCPCNCKKDTVFVHDTLRLTDTLIIHDTLRLTDTLRFTDTLRMYDTLRLTDTIFVYDTIIRYDTIRIRDTIIIEDTTDYYIGMEKKSHELELVIYPNPANQYLKLNGIFNSGEITIYNLSGVEMNQVYSIEEDENSVTLDISGLTEGLYFLVHEEHTVRFVKTD